jgi:hypothetical protein
MLMELGTLNSLKSESNIALQIDSKQVFICPTHLLISVSDDGRGVVPGGNAPDGQEIVLRSGPVFLRGHV